MTIQDFCKRHRIGRSTYYEILKKNGRAPKEIRIGRIIRITAKANRDWERMMEAGGTSGSDAARQALEQEQASEGERHRERSKSRKDRHKRPKRYESNESEKETGYRKRLKRRKYSKRHTPESSGSEA